MLHEQPDMVLDNRTISDAMTEVSRELLVRGSVYPKLVAAGKLTQSEANRRTAALRSALWYLEGAARAHQSARATTMG